MTRTLALIAALSLPVSSGEPIKVYLDGQMVGTLTLGEYRLSEGELHITTNEIVYGCQQARIYRDRFEP